MDMDMDMDTRLRPRAETPCLALPESLRIREPSAPDLTGTASRNDFVSRPELRTIIDYQMYSSCRLPGCAAGTKIHIHLYKYAHMQHARHKTPKTNLKKKGGGGRREESLSCMRIVSRRAGAKDYRAKDFCLASLPMRDAKHAYTT